MPAKAKKKKGAVVQMTPDAFRKMINNQFGEGTMIKASDPSLIIQRIPTGILAIDWRTSGGFPRGRYSELYGSASVGKSTVAMKLIASAQAQGFRCAYLDAEGSFDPIFAANLGVNLEELDYHRQITGNQLVDFAETLLRQQMHSVIVIDSVASLIPQYEVENNMSAGSMGAEQAKMMSKALRKLTAANKNTAVVFINQTREKLNVTFGKKTTTPAGRALPHYAGVRMELALTESIKGKGTKTNAKGQMVRDDIVIGHRVLARIEKDKTGGSKPFSECTFVFSYETSNIDPIEDLIYVGQMMGFVHQNASKKWWVNEYEDEQQNGRTRFKKWLKQNVAVQEELEEWIKEEIENPSEEPLEDDIEEDEEE